MTHTDSSDSSFYHVLLAPPAGTTPVNNPHNIALRLFNRDPTSRSSPASFQSIVFGALHCDSGLLFARTTSSLLYVGGHTTKNPGLYTSDGALLEEHLVGVTTFSLLDLYARPEALLPRGFQPAPRAQWAASFVVVGGGGGGGGGGSAAAVGGGGVAAPARHHNALTLRVRFASPFAISQGKYLEADYTLHLLQEQQHPFFHLLGGGNGEVVETSSSSSSSSSNNNNKRPRHHEKKKEEKDGEAPR